MKKTPKANPPPTSKVREILPKGYRATLLCLMTLSQKCANGNLTEQQFEQLKSFLMRMPASSAGSSLNGANALETYISDFHAQFELLLAQFRPPCSRPVTLLQPLSPDQREQLLQLDRQLLKISNLVKQMIGGPN